MSQIEWHGELTEDWDPGVVDCEDLSEHSVHSNDEQPLCKPSQEPERPGHPGEEEVAGVDDVDNDSLDEDDVRLTTKKILILPMIRLYHLPFLITSFIPCSSAAMMP